MVTFLITEKKKYEKDAGLFDEENSLTHREQVLADTQSISKYTKIIAYVLGSFR